MNVQKHPLKNSHCSYCGHSFKLDQPWPRTCPNCNQTSFVNPLPVAVILLPVDDGLLLIRRGIEPGRGKWAFPGGYIVLGETWQEAGVREVFEETNVLLDPSEIQEFRVHSAPDGTLLIFGLASPRSSAELPLFSVTEETTERIVRSQLIDMAFDLHTEVGLEFLNAPRKGDKII